MQNPNILQGERAFRSEKPGIQQHFTDVVARVHSRVEFGIDGFYCDYVEQRKVQPQAILPGNCNVFAAETAEELHGDYKTYVCHTGTHFFTVAVQGEDIHLINADRPGLSVCHIHKAGPEKKSLFFDDDTIARLQAHEDIIFSHNVRPSELIRPEVDPSAYFNQHWFRPDRSTAGLISWPDAHEYLIDHSRLRKLLKVSPTLDREIDVAAEVQVIVPLLESLAGRDITVDQSVEGKRLELYRDGLRRLVKAASTENELLSCAQLVPLFYPLEGPGHVGVLDGKQQRLEIFAAYQKLTRRAEELGLVILSQEFDLVATEGFQTGEHALSRNLGGRALNYAAML